MILFLAVFLTVVYGSILFPTSMRGKFTVNTSPAMSTSLTVCVWVFTGSQRVDRSLLLQFTSAAAPGTLPTSVWLQNRLSANTFEPRAELFGIEHQVDATVGAAMGLFSKPVGFWHHVAVSLDFDVSAVTAPTMRVYFDGSVIIESIDTPAVHMARLPTIFSVGFGTSQGFIGTVSEVTIFSRVLRPCEVSAMRTARGVVEELPSGLAAWYRFRQGALNRPEVGIGSNFVLLPTTVSEVGWVGDLNPSVAKLPCVETPTGVPSPVTAVSPTPMGAPSSPTTVMGAPSSPTTVMGAPSSPTTVMGAPSSPTTVMAAPSSPTTVMGAPSPSTPGMGGAPSVSEVTGAGQGPSAAGPDPISAEFPLPIVIACVAAGLVLGAICLTVVMCLLCRGSKQPRHPSRSPPDTSGKMMDRRSNNTTGSGSAAGRRSGHRSGRHSSTGRSGRQSLRVSGADHYAAYPIAGVYQSPAAPTYDKVSSESQNIYGPAPASSTARYVNVGGTEGMIARPARARKTDQYSQLQLRM